MRSLDRRRRSRPRSARDGWWSYWKATTSTRFCGDGLAVSPPGLHVGDPEPVDVGVARRIAEIRQIGESFVRSAQHLHADMLS